MFFFVFFNRFKSISSYGILQKLWILYVANASLSPNTCRWFGLCAMGFLSYLVVLYSLYVINVHYNAMLLCFSLFFSLIILRNVVHKSCGYFFSLLFFASFLFDFAMVWFVLWLWISCWHIRCGIFSLLRSSNCANCNFSFVGSYKLPVLELGAHIKCRLCVVQQFNGFNVLIHSSQVLRFFYT